MKKKIHTVMLFLFLLFVFFSSPTQSLCNKNSILPAKSSYTENQFFFTTLTLYSYTNLLKSYIDTLSLPPIVKQQLHASIEKGVSEMKEYNILPSQTIQEILQYQPVGFRGPFQRHHMFLMNIYPDVVSINVILPTYLINLTTQNESTNSPQVLEIFVKLIPVFDSIQTQNRIFLRKLYQKTSMIWPAIGGRILQNNTTVFILAFGPKIEWKMRFF